jgi:ribonuclease Z
MFSITFLGTSSGTPTVARAHSAIALQLDGEIILFDCGEGTQRQMMKAKTSMMKVRRIFITHWHADHSLGLGGLIQTMSLLGRTEALEIYGPSGTKKYMKSLLDVGHFNPKYQLRVNELKDGEKVEAKGYTVLAIDAKHSVPALSYRMDEPQKPGKFDRKKAESFGLKPPQFGELQRGNTQKVGRKTIKPSDVMGPPREGASFVYSGDTAYNESLVKLSKKATVLVHESSFANDKKDFAKEVLHSTAEDAATVAKKAGVKSLVLTHISPRYLETDVLLKEASKIFKNTTIVKDFDKLEFK